MSQAQKSPHEDFIMAFLVLFILGGLSWLIWHFFSLQLTNFVRWLRVAELYLVSLLFGNDTTVMVEGTRLNVGQLKDWLPGLNPASITTTDIKMTTQVALTPLRLVFIGLIVAMAGVVMFKGPGTQYKRRMGLEMLMKEQAKAFPIISPFLKFDPRKMPFRAPGQPVPEKLPLFSEALSPEEWLAFHDVRMSGASIDFSAAYRGLVLQLGKRWQGPLKLGAHAQGLYAAFALRHVRKRKECEELLNQLAMAWDAKGGFRPSVKLMSKIRGIIKNPKIGGAIQKFADQHAYETTALLRCLSRAREEGGVLAPAQFLWLRGHDRTLWYPLNNLGRKSYHAEAAGAMVHYTNELIAGQKIPTPRLDEVIRSFETYMKSGAGRAIPEKERKGARK